ncbi:MAG: Wzz/FepE/Etk N-terminal domain-containing protein [Tenericutes bacterium]|jgi:capsular polysaccharide biosynthesis protein|nr:Wzz/FepE/Etk N-terminal domain-containing protein [Mycoplasmatota bacterium]
MNEYIGNVPQEEEEGISIRDLFKIVLNNLALIIIVGFWTVVLGVVYTFVIVTPKYTANASLMVQVDVEDTNNSEQSAIVIGNLLIGTYQEFLISDRVLESVIADVDGLESKDLNSLRNSISVQTQNQILKIDVQVENEDPILAASIANSLVEKSIENAADFVLLKDKLELLDEARVPVNPSSPNKVLNIAISIILGGILALGVVFIKEVMNNKFKTPEELEKYLDIKVLASVPGTIKERRVVE